MLRIMWNGKAAMNANQEKLDAISNNLANSGTVGYKKVDVEFKDLLSETLDRQGYPTTNNKAYTGTGVRTSNWVRNNAQGSLTETGVSTNFAVDGEGYFRVTTSDGSYAYVRAGDFNIDVNGQLVDADGNRLNIEFANGYSYNNVRFSKDNFAVDDDGNIFMNVNNEFEKVGEIPVYNVIGSTGFISKGDNLYVPASDATVYRETNVAIKQGFIENSNIDIAEEFTDMILAQRAFQLGSKAISTADEMWSMVNQLKK